MKVFLGIDWGHSRHDICFMNVSGQVLSRLTVEHTAEGLAELEQARVQLGVSREDCRIGLETAHTLVIDFLWDQGCYPVVFVIPPGAIKGARRRFGQTHAHTDDSDAWLIADVVRTDPATLYPWRPDSLLVRQLRTKVKQRGPPLFMCRWKQTPTISSHAGNCCLVSYYRRPLRIEPFWP